MSRKGILGIGAPVLDSFAFVEDIVLESIGATKNSVFFTDIDSLKELKAKLKFEVEAAGGSVMNAIRWMGLMGYDVSFIGQYGDDEWGKVLEKALADCNVKNKCVIKRNYHTTNACILVSPDGARTMTGSAGASADDYCEWIDWNFIKDYESIVIEAFNFNTEELMKAMDAVIPKALELKVKIALMISPTASMEPCKSNLMKYFNKVNVVTGNHEEWISILGKSNVEEVLDYLEKSHFELAAVTMAEKGAWIVKDGKRYFFNAPDVDKVIDTTGAGDSFAGGLIFSYFSGFPIEKIGKVATHIPGYVISGVGGVPYTETTKGELKAFLESC